MYFLTEKESEHADHPPPADSFQPADSSQPASDEAASSDVQVIAVLDFDEDDEEYADQDTADDNGNMLTHPQPHVTITPSAD